jgi:hypothetical protein
MRPEAPPSPDDLARRLLVKDAGSPSQRVLAAPLKP